jgi:hypothetical protein
MPGLSEKPADQQGELTAMQAEIRRLRAENEQLAAENGRLDAANVQLLAEREDCEVRLAEHAKRIRHLERQLGQVESRENDRRKQSQGVALTSKRLSAQLFGERTKSQAAAEQVEGLTARIEAQDEIIRGVHRSLRDIADHGASPGMVRDALHPMFQELDKQEWDPEDLRRMNRSLVAYAQQSRSDSTVAIWALREIVRQAGKRASGRRWSDPHASFGVRSERRITLGVSDPT